VFGRAGDWLLDTGVIDAEILGALPDGHCSGRVLDSRGCAPHDAETAARGRLDLEARRRRLAIGHQLARGTDRVLLRFFRVKLLSLIMSLRVAGSALPRLQGDVARLGP
jgi:hypothetical protein